MRYAVIMAGGTGKRLWPLSRKKRPKQVLQLLNGQTLLRKCYSRLAGIFDPRNILVLTNADYVDLVRENLVELPEENVIAEPAVRDTAAAIGLAAAILQKYDNNATMAIVTADQVLNPAEVFQTAMVRALDFVDDHPEALVTFGIKPTYPSTQYGYIQFGAQADSTDPPVHAVQAFREKPDVQTAETFLKEGGFYWNAGLFVWRCDLILNHLARHLPDCIEPLSKIQMDWGSENQQRTLTDWFPKMPKISIDFAVMEKAEHVYGIPMDCRWQDLGSYAALADIVESDANQNIVVAGFSEMLDSKNNIVVTEAKDHLIALIGVENMVIAHSKDATLVCPKDQCHRLKELLEFVHHHKDGHFL